MQIIYTQKALRDLQAIREYYGSRTPMGLQNIVNDIINVVEGMPNTLSKGRSTPHPDVWEKVTPKYHYLLPYCIFQGKLYILRVYDPRRGGLDYTDIMDLSE
mgnify:CR=1 FL=1